jgi:hypothetical protein
MRRAGAVIRLLGVETAYMNEENPFGDGETVLRFFLGTIQFIVFMLALSLLALVSYPS